MKRTIGSIRLCLFGAALVTWGGCNDADDLADDLLPSEKDAGPVDIELEVDDGDEFVVDIDDNEKMAICQALTNGINEGVGSSTKCTFGGIGAGAGKAGMGDLEGLRSACKDFVDTCKPAAIAGESVAPEIPIPECPLFKGDTAGDECPATPLAVFEKCIEYLGQQTADTLANVQCDNLSIDRALELAKGAAVDVSSDILDASEDCRTVIEKCPGIFEVGGGGGADAGAADAGAADAGAPDAT